MGSLDKPRRKGPRASLALVMLACATVSLTPAAQTPLTLVSTVWPPFTNVPGQPRFALDLVEAAFGRIGVTGRTTIVDAAQFTSSLLASAVDGSAAAWRDPERERVLIFSQPYLENRLVLVGPRGADVSARTLADLAGKRVSKYLTTEHAEGTENISVLKNKEFLCDLCVLSGEVLRVAAN